MLIIKKKKGAEQRKDANLVNHVPDIQSFSLTHSLEGSGVLITIQYWYTSFLEMSTKFCLNTRIPQEDDIQDCTFCMRKLRPGEIKVTWLRGRSGISEGERGQMLPAFPSPALSDKTAVTDGQGKLFPVTAQRI